MPPTSLAVVRIEPPAPDGSHGARPDCDTAAVVPAGTDDSAQAPPRRLLDAGALERLLTARGRSPRVLHSRVVPARPGATADWPAWADDDVVAALVRSGVGRPWRHQVEAADLAHAGRHVVVSTGTASGKSLAYLLPVLTALRADPVDGLGATALYLAPTKALAGDQLATIESLRLDRVRVASYDGDTPAQERRWVREHADYVLTNPDLLHASMLPGHPRWASFLRRLRYVVVDECHHYRGVFGSHVAAVLRRLRRVAARYGASPVFVLASATTAQPARTASQLVGLPAQAVTQDFSRRGATSVLLWEPPILGSPEEQQVPVRRSALAETSELLADLVSHQVRTLAFVRSRRGAETVATMTRERLASIPGSSPQQVAAYRSGYLPEERRALEADLRSGRLLALAATSALELGIDVAGLDAVLMAGWPGSRASFWQQAGRAGRAGQDCLAVLVSRDDPLDSYLVHHPEAIFDAPLDATVLDTANPHVLAPHLCAAAAELPLTDADLPLFGETTGDLLEVLVARQALRRRPTGWYWTSPTRASDLADLRGTGGKAVDLIETSTGRVLGSVDDAASHRTVHPGAVYLHQGTPFVVERLDLDQHLAFLRHEQVAHTTQARQTTGIRVLTERSRQRWGPVSLVLGEVGVTSQVTSFLRRRAATGEVMGEEALELPERRLRTVAVWWTLTEDLLARHGVAPPALAGAAHAAEHAAIALLPLVATCDRWDVGGVSTGQHPDTGRPTVFVHDAYRGGAGFAERGYAAAGTWLRATLATVAGCRCEAGCPSCVQSPSCGRGNEPLDKAGAVRLLAATLAEAPPAPVPTEPAAAPVPPIRPDGIVGGHYRDRYPHPGPDSPWEFPPGELPHRQRWR